MACTRHAAPRDRVRYLTRINGVGRGFSEIRQPGMRRVCDTRASARSCEPPKLIAHSNGGEVPAERAFLIKCSIFFPVTSSTSHRMIDVDARIFVLREKSSSLKYFGAPYDKCLFTRALQLSTLHMNNVACYHLDCH